MDEDDIACLQNSVQKPWEPAGAEEVGHHGPLHVSHPTPPHHGLHTQVFRQLKLLPCCDWILKTASKRTENIYSRLNPIAFFSSAAVLNTPSQRSEDFLKNMYSRLSTPLNSSPLKLCHKIWVDFLSKLDVPLPGDWSACNFVSVFRSVEL